MVNDFYKYIVNNDIDGIKKCLNDNSIDKNEYIHNKLTPFSVVFHYGNVEAIKLFLAHKDLNINGLMRIYTDIPTVYVDVPILICIVTGNHDGHAIEYLNIILERDDADFNMKYDIEGVIIFFFDILYKNFLRDGIDIIKNVIKKDCFILDLTRHNSKMYKIFTKQEVSDLMLEKYYKGMVKYDNNIHSKELKEILASRVYTLIRYYECSVFSK